MYEYLVGTLTEKEATRATLEVAGVGYHLEVSATSARQLPVPRPSPALTAATGKADLVRLYTVLHTTESGPRLFGFVTPEERQMFRLLQAVRGVGPSVALSILSHESPERLLELLRSGDATRLTRIKGIGRKTAERLLVELKDRLPEQAFAAGPVPGGAPEVQRQLVDALQKLGVVAAEAEDLARRALADQPDGAEVGELLRVALQYSARSRSAVR